MVNRTNQDSTLVAPPSLLEAQHQVSVSGPESDLEALRQTEPLLAAYIHEQLATISGKLVLSDAPVSVAKGVYGDALMVVLTAVRAYQHAHLALWRDCIAGTPLAKLDPNPPRRKARRRKKSDRPEAGGEVTSD